MTTIKLKDYLKSQHKSYISHKIERDSFIEYLKHLDVAYAKIKESAKSNATEENIKNIFADFLKNAFYKNISDVEINTYNKIDYAIKKDGYIEVIMEFKKPSNKAEMITVDPKTNTYNLNKKALHEAIKYFYDEKHKGNYHIKNIIISDGLSFFIFDGTQFQNKHLEKLCYGAIKGDLYLQNTKDIYQAIHDEIERNQINFDYAWFDLEYLEKRIKNFDLNNVDINDKAIRTLLYVYKLLHPDFLLNQYSPKDSNQLNKKFYDELLYILGLEEVSEGSKRLIQPNNNEKGLINETIYQLKEQKNIFSQDEAVSIAFELVITWLNRILFLKLFEAQLIAFNNDKNFRFITSDKISNFDDLNHLFFAVLGKKHQERQSQEQTQHIPYLNSSLFELSDIEAKYFSITALHDKTKLEVLKSSNLKKKWLEYKNKPEEHILKYLLDFLDSYDFSSEANNNLITEENKDIINSAVLGLIFEKLNGYKDGSFYTPGFITEYMAKESIERAVVSKFNEALEIEAKDVNEVKSFIGKVYKKEDFTKYNDLVNSLKILDPAVGSGHFLVSVLNHIIYLKSYLGILWDGEAKVDNIIDIFDDTLIVFTENDTPFVYKKSDRSTHILQKTLFNEKKTIIENCIFAVDINPKSVYICQLRLWIELLKNTYYINNSYEMDVLPNIDINIKTGNSLISKFPIKIGKSAIADSKKLKGDIKDYKKAVSEYKNSGDKQTKQEVKNKITEIKRQLVSTAQYDMFSDNKKLIDENIYKNSMEWMIEFPEVLNENGEFQGFDVVIGNPPYGVSIKGSYRSVVEQTFGKVPDYEIYYFFTELSYLLLKSKGILNYIIPNTFLFNTFAEIYRKKLLQTWQLNEILDCSSFPIFETATVRNAVIRYIKDNTKDVVGYRKTKDIESFKRLLSQQSLTIKYDELLKSNQNWSLAFKLDIQVINLINKIKENTPLIETFPEISQGLIAYDKYKGQEEHIIKSRAYHSNTFVEGFSHWLWGEDVKKYNVKWNSKEYINYCKEIANPRDPKFFRGRRILVREITNPSIYAAITSEELYNDPAVIIILDNNQNLEALLGVLNSKLATFYHFNNSPKAIKGAFPKILVKDIKDFPLPNLTRAKYISSNVEEILRLTNTQDYEQNKAVQNKVKKLEAEIDQIVYKLYDLTDEEIKIVEGSNG